MKTNIKTLLPALLPLAIAPLAQATTVCNAGEIAVGLEHLCITGSIGVVCGNSGGQDIGMIWDHNCNVLSLNTKGLCGTGYTDEWVGVSCVDYHPYTVLSETQVYGHCREISTTCGTGLGIAFNVWACCEVIASV